MLVVDRQFLLAVGHVIESVLVDRFLVKRACNVLVRLELILLVDHLAHVDDDLLLDRIGIFSNL